MASTGDGPKKPIPIYVLSQPAYILSPSHSAHVPAHYLLITDQFLCLSYPDIPHFEQSFQTLSSILPVHILLHVTPALLLSGSVPQPLLLSLYRNHHNHWHDGFLLIQQFSFKLSRKNLRFYIILIEIRQSIFMSFIRITIQRMHS